MNNFQQKLFTRLTQETWKAIRSVRRKWPDEIDWPEARRKIEQVGREFSKIETLREQRRRSVEYNDVLNSARIHLRRLQDRLSRLEMLSPSGDDLRGLPDPGLKLLVRRLHHLRVQYEKWSTPFSGKKNPLRDTLDDQLLTIWEKQLLGRLGSSKNKFDEPIGPLIRFLTVTLTAITGAPPGPHGIRNVIYRAKKRRLRRASKRRKPAVGKQRRNRQKS